MARAEVERKSWRKRLLSPLTRSASIEAPQTGHLAPALRETRTDDIAATHDALPTPEATPQTAYTKLLKAEQAIDAQSDARIRGETLVGGRTKGADVNDSGTSSNAMSRTASVSAPISPVDDVVDLPLLRNTLTPKWNEAISTWQLDDPEGFMQLTRTVRYAQDHIWTNFQSADVGSKEVVTRLKRWQGTLASFRGIAMPLAALDPNKIAPIVCASIFGSIDVLFNSMNPEDKAKIVSILADCDDNINDCLYFERTFMLWAHPRTKDRFQLLADDLPKVYLQALELASRMQKSCHDIRKEFEFSEDGPHLKSRMFDRLKTSIADRGRHMISKLTNEIASWEVSAQDMSRRKATWNKQKAGLEKELESDKAIKEVLKWIKKEDDPEQPLEIIGDRVTSSGRFARAGQWVLDSATFREWEVNLRKSTSDHDAKRVIWLHGTLGTGKTTIMYRILEHLRSSGSVLVDGSIRIVHYFCDANTLGTIRPDHATILRALLRRLSLLPNYTLDAAVQDKYVELSSAARSDSVMRVVDWERLFEDIIAKDGATAKFVFVVDALDECVDSQQSQLFLNFMKRILGSTQKSFMIFSSRDHIAVDEYFDESLLHVVASKADSTQPDMRVFIEGEVEFREQHAGKRCIFYQPEGVDLRKQMVNDLTKHAQGMFRWVQIWLDILIPTHDRRHTITMAKTAREKLRQLGHDLDKKLQSDDLLNAAYTRLWNEIPNEQSLRDRLFHVILAALQPLTRESLSEALSIDEQDYTPVSIDMISLLCANFLVEAEDDPVSDDGGGGGPSAKTDEAEHCDVPGNDIEIVVGTEHINNSVKLKLFGRPLRFVHNSARTFVLGLQQEGMHQFAEQQNHARVAEIYINLLSSHEHPAWRAIGLDLNPDQWRNMRKLHWDHFDVRNKFTEMYHYGAPGFKSGNGTFHFYLVQEGLEHCLRAATSRIFYDPLLSRVIEKVIVNESSAFGATLIATENSASHPLRMRLPRKLKSYEQNVWHMHDSGPVILTSKMVMVLDSVDDNSLSCMHTDDSTAAASMPPATLNRFAELFVDACLPGLSFSDILEPGKESTTCLQDAVMRHDSDLAEFVIRAIAKKGVHAIFSTLGQPSPSTQHPFRVAIDRGSTSMVEMLLRVEQDLIARYPEEAREHDQLVGFSVQWCMPDSWQRRMHDAQETFHKCRTALHMAIQKFSEAQVLRLLTIARPRDIYWGPWYQQPEITTAILSNQINLARWLIATYGFGSSQLLDKHSRQGQHSLYYRSRSGYDVLSSVVRSGHIKAVRFLLDDLQVIPHRADRYEKSRHAHDFVEEDRYDWTLLHSAAKWGHLQLVKLLVSEYRLDPDAMSHYRPQKRTECPRLGEVPLTPALLAFDRGHKEVLRYLYSCGAKHIDKKEYLAYHQSEDYLAAHRNDHDHDTDGESAWVRMKDQLAEVI